MMDMWISHLCRVNEAKAKSLFASYRRSTSFASTWLDDGQTGMYGPPLCRKRKMKVDRMVCANVFGLLSEHKLLALMECAARSSSLVMQPWKAFPVYRFRERRVRPLCHLIVRQQTWQKIINSVVAAGL